MDQYAAQHQLQGLLGYVVQVDHRVEVAVPHADELPHADGGDDRRADRQQDLEEVNHLACAVDGGRLLKVAGYALVVGAGDDHVPDAEGAGQQYGPDSVEHSQIADEQVGGNQAATEEHRDHVDRVEESLEPEIRPGHRVRRQQRHDHGDDGEQHRIDQRVLEAHPDLGIAQHAGIGRRGPLAEIKGHALVLQRDGIDEGGQYDVQHRDDDGCQEDAQEHIGNDQYRLVTGGVLGKFTLLLSCRNICNTHLLTLLSLNTLAFVHLLDNGIHGDQQDDVDDGVEEADGGGKAVVAVQKALLVNVGGDDLGSAHVQVGLQRVGLFKADAHDVAHRHDELNEHGVLDRRPLNRLDLLDQVRAVDDGCLLQILAGI